MNQTEIRRSRRLLSLTIIFFWASEYCHAPYFTPYLQTLGFAATTIGVITGLYGFTQMLVRIPLGMFTDATGWYKRTIVGGTFCTTISSFGLMFATSLPAILICRVLAGLAASTWLAFTVLYNAYYAADESVQAMTNVNAFNSMGKFLAFILGLITATLWGYKVPLVCSFLTGLAAMACALFLKPIQLRRESFQLKHAVQVMRNPAVICAAAFSVVMNFFLQGTVYSFTSGVAKSIGASAFEIGASTILFTLVQILGANLIGKKLLKKINAAQAISSGFLLLTVSCVLVGLAANMPMIYLAQIIGGGANLMMSSVLMAMIVRHTPQEKQSTAMGLYQAVYGIGMAAGPVCVGGMVNAGGYAMAYLVTAGIVLLAGLAAPFAVSRADRD